ncbi:MAG TPA: universal stress protein [Segetibacter sp.]|jgi:nucleotide-binding universal stress UspA family protein
MKNLIVPTDFSTGSKNAALYAIELAKVLNVTNIILFHAFQPAPSAIIEAGNTPFPMVEVETVSNISHSLLQQFKLELQAHCPENISLQAIDDFSSVNDGINEICNKTPVEVIVMGITGTSKIEEVLIGSTAISVMKNTRVPVIIVPEAARYAPVKNIMFACDYKKIVETTPVAFIKSILSVTKARLQIVNVSEGKKDALPDKAEQQELLRSIFGGYEVFFHFIDDTEFITGVNNFVDANNVDMIITVPKKHSFFEGLFKEKHTKKLAFHSRVPIVCVHQEDL